MGTVGIEYRGNDEIMALEIGTGRLEITTRFELVEGSDQKIAIGRDCQYMGMLPHEIMLELARWSERMSPSVLTINGKTVLEFLESM